MGYARRPAGRDALSAGGRGDRDGGHRNPGDRPDLLDDRAQVVAAGFEALRPASRAVGQIRLWDNLWNDQFVAGFRRMERWGNETLPLPGRYFKELTQQLLRDNELYNGKLRVGGWPVDLGKITIPLLHVVAQYDHIVPSGCSAPLIKMIGSTDKEEVVLPGGHVSIAAGANAIKRMWPKLDSWLQGRST